MCFSTVIIFVLKCLQRMVKYSFYSVQNYTENFWIQSGKFRFWQGLKQFLFVYIFFRISEQIAATYGSCTLVHHHVWVARKLQCSELPEVIVNIITPNSQIDPKINKPNMLNRLHVLTGKPSCENISYLVEGNIIASTFLLN